MNSLDPRVNRLPAELAKNTSPKAPLDQFGTFEVFVQAREGKPFQHEGIVHAPNLEMAYVLAKETFTRRFTCVSIYVADTREVFVSPLTDNNVNAYDLINEVTSSDKKKKFEIYHLVKRGKQHVHKGTVEASGPDEAMWEAKKQFGSTPVLNVWAIPTESIRFTTPAEQQELWLTLPEKKFRDAAAYKGGDKLKEVLEKMKG